MLSVSRSSSKKLHFWLIENFLSPQFKAFFLFVFHTQDIVPELCRHFGYKVSYVSYKWPRWVYPQTEKQRIIWAYKILFLDTLFPLRVKKVPIFGIFNPDYLRGCGPSKSCRPLGAVGYGYSRLRLRLHAALHVQSRNKRIYGRSRRREKWSVVLDPGILEGTSARKAVSHQRFV